MTNSSKATPQQPAREDHVKRWLGILIAFVTLLVTATSFLEDNASTQQVTYARYSKENSTASTAQRVRGLLDTTFASHLVREYDELMDQARSLDAKRPLEASAFITAAQTLARESPLLALPYTMFDERGWRKSTDYARFHRDTLSTRFSFRV